MQPDTRKQNSADKSSDTQELEKSNCSCFILSYLKGNNFEDSRQKIRLFS